MANDLQSSSPIGITAQETFDPWTPLLLNFIV